MCDEIKITAEMISAGYRAYLDHDEILETKEELIAAIFTAMLLAAKKEDSAS
jgi:hypothetical protein